MPAAGNFPEFPVQNIKSPEGLCLAAHPSGFLFIYKECLNRFRTCSYCAIHRIAGNNFYM